MAFVFSALAIMNE